MTGTIRQQLIDKGFGFITGEDGQSYFFHKSACISHFDNDLKPGRKVQFDSVKGPKGMRAEGVSLQSGI